MPAKAFLDVLVARASVPTTAAHNITLFEPLPQNVTDIHLGAFISYALILVLVAVPYLALVVRRCVLGTPRGPNILSYDGLVWIFNSVLNSPECKLDEGAGAARTLSERSSATNDAMCSFHSQQSGESSC